MGRGAVTRADAVAFVKGGLNTTVQRCPFGPLVRVGATGARRGLCGLDRLPAKAHLFSFGSNGDFGFEDAVRAHRADLNVTVFDPTMARGSMAARPPSALRSALAHARRMGYTFVPIGIGYRKGWLEMSTVSGRRLFCAKVDTLPALLRETGADSIGVLKIDASGEFEVIAKLKAHSFDLRTRVGILLLEVHLFHPQADGTAANCCYGPSDIAALTDQLASAGFVLVDRELGDCCAELSFVNPGWPGFGGSSTR